MSLNPPSGNMFLWCSTSNPWGGYCPYCTYCYRHKPFFSRMKKYQGPFKLHYSEEENPLPSWNNPKSGCIWIGSMIEVMSPLIPSEEIWYVLAHANKYPLNDYLILSKFPMRFKLFEEHFPPKVILGTTIETNRDIPRELSTAPRPYLRYKAFTDWTWWTGTGFRKMLSIEPVMDFDLSELVQWIIEINPHFISIGANTYSGVKHPQPSAHKLHKFIDAAEKHTEVRLKSNLSQILGEEGVVA